MPSALLLILLLAAAAAAQWSDVIYAYAFSTAPSQVCAPNGRCVYVVKLNMSGAHGVIAGVAGAFDPRSTIMHPHGVYADTNAQLRNIYMPAGVYFSDWSFSINGMTPARYTICHMTLERAIYVSRSGRHNLTLFDRVYYIDPHSCFVYLFAAQRGYIYNITGGRATVFWFEMPRARGVWTHTTTYDNALNATEHQYRVSWRGQLAGVGFYIANYTRTPAFAAAYTSFFFYSYGPVHYAALRNATQRALGDSVAVFNIAHPPADGILLVRMPDRLYGNASITFFSNDTAGYIDIINNGLVANRYLYVYAKRYDIGEVVVTDDIYTYGARTIACPHYTESGTRIATIATRLTRLDRVREIEICSNRTDTLYVRVSAYAGTAFVDVLEPGRCRRLRWDAELPLSDVRLHFYRSPRDVCRDSHMFSIATSSLAMSWRYALFQNNTLRPVAPIRLDALYEAAWRQIVEELRRQNNMTQQALQQWLQMQANASRSIAEYVKSQPRFIGTIRVESATSTWLNAMLSEIRRYAVAGPPPAAVGGGGFAAAPLPSSAAAAAAAAAVATAWAASRRSLASAAFLAGFAILAAAVFMYYLYGASVTAGLILAAVSLMSLGAAAVWFRKTEN